VDAIYTVTPAPPLVITCPPSQTFCEIAGNNHTIPALIATDGCGKPLTISYEVTGATTRSGTGTDASGIFDVGVSTITWTVTDACGNISTCTTTVTINPLPVPVATSNSPVCVGGALNLFGAPDGMSSYSWTGPNGFTSNVQNPVIDSATALAAGTYTLTVTNSNGCTASTTVDVVINPLPEPSITPSQDPVCANTGTVTYTTPQVGCNTYSWTISAGGTIIGSSTGNSIEVVWTTAGPKTVTVTETMCGVGGCSKTVSKEFIVNPKPNTTPITHD
jgi:hypothetical protein